MEVTPERLSPIDASVLILASVSISLILNFLSYPDLYFAWKFTEAFLVSIHYVSETIPFF